MIPKALLCLTVAAALASPTWAKEEPAAKPAKKPPEKSAAGKEAQPGRPGDEEKEEKEKKPGWNAESLSGLAFRGIGPALTSGRVVDIAVDPTRPSRWYLAVASGGVWKTENAGTSWTPLFDKEGSHSIGCVAIDPNNPFVIWAGSGENNNQRSVGYGDGIYRSDDGGKTWKNVGLKSSEHIAKILIHPKDSNTVYVAAQGPLWAPGGDRGLYKTTDGGKTWKAVLTIGENTGVTDVVMDPRNPDVLIAAAHQRRRHVWTMIDGGPESAMYKTTDGGTTWRKIKNGLPKEDMGRIGLAISPVDPDTVYAIVEAAGKAGGFFRSTDRGENWEKRSDHSTSGNYYSEIFADPASRDRVYSMDTFLKVTDDAGKTFRNLGEASKHVDNHVIWVDPEHTEHYLVGCDGGVYESWDAGATWDFKANLPVAQFYRVEVDQSSPVYYVYGGTQDNSSLGTPSRTLNEHGITNQDWFITWGGDGFHSRVDPQDPNIVYSTLQNGVLGRYDRKSGESILISPQPGKGEEPLRWNWDSPLLISPHSHTRLYFAANRVFRSDDRGDSWTPVSGDLTRRLDRNRLKVMGKVWGPDAVAKSQSTSFYGNIVSFDESPLTEGLLYVGTDDGLVQVTEDGGKAWRREEKLPGVPERTYVSDLFASQHDANVLYASFNDHKMGDFKPYLLKSADRGRTWTSIAGDLPARGSVWTVAEDPIDKDLLFCGTEFGLFVSKDGGKKWVQLKGGLPVIPVRDIAIQKREGDLVIATFGRGIYILDDYSPLRAAKPAELEQGDLVFPVKKTLGYVSAVPFGLRAKAFLGESFYEAPNPPFGAVFTYYLKEEIKTRQKRRQDAEKAADKKGEEIRYPSAEELRAEAREEEPAVILTVVDAEGNIVRRLSGPVKAGMQRVAWDLRFPPANPTSLKPPPTDNPFIDPPAGPMVVPGTYNVSFAKRVDGVETPFGSPQTVEVAPLNLATLGAADKAALLQFERKTARLQRAVLGAIEVAGEAEERIKHIKKALDDTPGGDPKLGADARAIEARMRDVVMALKGDEEMRRRNEPTAPGIADRVSAIVNSHWTSTAAPTGTNQQAYEIAAEAFEGELGKLRQLVEMDMRKLEASMEAGGAPWTPGRVPVWRRE